MREIQISISSDLCIRLTWNLTGSCGQQQRLRGWSRMMVKQSHDGGRPPFWKSIYCHISAKNHPTSTKLCTQQQILNWMNVTWLKMKKSCIGQTASSTECISCCQYMFNTLIEHLSSTVRGIAVTAVLLTSSLDSWGQLIFRLQIQHSLSYIVWHFCINKPHIDY